MKKKQQFNRFGCFWDFWDFCRQEIWEFFRTGKKVWDLSWDFEPFFCDFEPKSSGNTDHEFSCLCFATHFTALLKKLEREILLLFSFLLTGDRF